MAKKSFKSAIDKTKLGEKSGVSAVFSSTTDKKETPKAQVVQTSEPEEPQEPKSARHSIVIREDYLDKLKDFVYFKKKNDDPFYSQKDALHEAFDMLFATVEEIPERPKAVKLAEKKRSGNLKKAKAKK